MDYDSCSSLPAMFFDRTAEMGDQTLLAAKRRGEWQETTAAAARSATGAIGSALGALGVEAGDRIALLSESRPEWMVADVGIMAAGAISVPLYVTNSVADHLHVLRDSGARGAILSGPAPARNFLPAAAEAGLEFVITMEALDGDDAVGGVRIESWPELVERHSGVLPDLSAMVRTDTACLIYTSGTGGAPKGVMLSHGAILANCKGAYELLLELGLGRERFLSFLPLSHSYEHTAGLFFPLSIKAEIYYCEGLDRLAANMEEVRPTIMTAVPRLYETMHGRIVKGLRQKGGLSEKLFMKAVSIGRKRYEGQPIPITDHLLDRLLDRLVRAKVAARFGGRLKALVSGGAPLNYDIGVFFLALGVEMLQGYGMTESAPIISCNLPGRRNRIRTVGPPVADTEVKIADDGEILVRGELVMNGYWGKPEETGETVKDGWLHTGDIGEFDEAGYLVITDRKKDIIVNSGGDNISPQRIEGFLTLQPEILQAMVTGDRKPYLVALVVPDPEFAADWAAADKPGDLEGLVQDEDFRKAVSDAVDRVNINLSVIERVRKHIIVAEPFTIENSMMTPSMKIRRHAIRARFGDDLESLYR